jgi:hypothetical protein
VLALCHRPPQHHSYEQTFQLRKVGGRQRLCHAQPVNRSVILMGQEKLEHPELRIEHDEVVDEGIRTLCERGP